MDEYVRKDVFGAKMDRMEAIEERNVARYEAIASDMRGEIKAINTRMSSIEDKISLNVTVTGVLVGAFGVIITIVIAIIQLWR